MLIKRTAPSLLCHENAARFDAYYLPLGNVSPSVAQIVLVSTCESQTLLAL